ncbi:MAG: 4Fe-4S dicluster domain-containing protein [Candidatus Hodarchaeales archaeon]
MPVFSGVTAGNHLIAIKVSNSCIKCKKCVKSCPVEILFIDKDKPVVQIREVSKCLECRACEVICPVDAIEVN